MSDALFASSAAAATAATAAKAAQVKQMLTYVAGVQDMFEAVLTDMLLQQPADPHAFLIQSLQAMPVSEREAVKAQLAAQDERKNNQEDPNYNRAKNFLIVVLTLTLNKDPASKASVIATLKELQKAAKEMPACIRYDLCHNASTRSILIDQCWTTQEALDAFYASPAFARATPQLQGKLAGPPEQKTYNPL